MGMKIGFMASLGFVGMDPREVCRTLKEIGYDSVEWTTAHCNPREKTAQQLSELVRITEDNGLAVSEVVVQQDYVSLDEARRKDAVAFTIECVEAFREAGIGCVNVFTGPAPWAKGTPVVGRDISEGRAWDMVVAAFDEIVPRAESVGMNVAVENVWGMLAHDFYTCRHLINRYGSPVFGVNFDPSHDILAGNLDVPWLIRQWGDRIKHCHVKDAVGTQEEGKFIFPLIGEGLVDWPGFFGTLSEIGFEGTCSVEFESFRYLKQILGDDIRKAAAMSMEQIERVRS